MKLRGRSQKSRKGRARRPGSSGRAPWIAVGTFVAYTAIGGQAKAAETPSAEREGGGGSSGTAPFHAQPSRQFTIPAGALDAVLASFREATGVDVRLANEAIRDIHSPGVTGAYTFEQALKVLLQGTRVTYLFHSPQQVSLELRLQESVEVSARSGPSSPKYTQPLRDIPQTVMVIPSTMIEEQNATTLRDVLRNVTGISMQAGEGGVPAGDNLSIRGFSARTDLFVDGVRDFGGYSRDPFNIEQVEVTKGPASSYSGRGSTGGSINLATKAPNLAASRSGTAGVGSSAYKRGASISTSRSRALPSRAPPSA